MRQPQWSGVHPDYVVIKPAPNVDIGDMSGEWLDRRKAPYLDIALEVYGCKLIPTSDFEISDKGEVAQVWILEKVN